MNTRLRRALPVAASVALAVLTIVALGTAGARVTMARAHAPLSPPQETRTGLPRPTTSDGRSVVAVALGASGTVLSDALAPFEVFGRSPRVAVYTVAATTAPVPTQGGPDIVPDHSFADVEDGSAPPPDVVVVPAVDAPDGPAETELRSWVVEQERAGARILGVCYGSGVLAAAGLLDGRTATSHWSRLGALAEQHPEVRWVDGQRFVTDGAVTTTAGVTSGIPGALRVLAGLAGPDEARRVGAAVGYPGWSLTQPTEIPRQSWAAGDLPVVLNALIPWGRPTTTIALEDGTGEIDLAAAFEVLDVSYAATPLPVSRTGTVVTRHGMVLRTRTLVHAPPPDRITAPAPGGFDAALEQLARVAGRATAVSAAKMVDYPSAHLRLEGAAGPRIPALLALGVALSALAGMAPILLPRARRARRRAGGPH